MLHSDRDVVELEAAKASGESSLETKLQGIVTTWDELVFEVKSHREQRVCVLILFYLSLSYSLFSLCV